MQSESTAGYHSDPGYHGTQCRRHAERQYTFKVAKDANKVEIAQAAEALFQVQVLKVNTVNCTGKTKRMGRNVGKRPDFKKAVITINPDPEKGKDGTKRKGTIEFFDGMF